MDHINYMIMEAYMRFSWHTKPNPRATIYIESKTWKKLNVIHQKHNHFHYGSFLFRYFSLELGPAVLCLPHPLAVEYKGDVKECE